MRRTAGLVLAAGLLVVGCSSSGDSGGETGGPFPTTGSTSETPLLPSGKQRLIDALDPAADCSSSESQGAPSPSGGLVLFQTVRVVGDCLKIEYTVIDAGELESRTSEALIAPDVVAAGEASWAATWSVATAGSPDPLVGKQWFLDELHVSALDELSVDSTTPPVRVAVIDNGIDDSVTDLTGLVAERGRWAGRPSGDNSNAAPHGTHVAGVIAAKADNGFGGRGIARHVELLDVTNDEAQASPTVADAIYWAARHGAKVINMSFCELGASGKLPCSDKPNPATAAAVAFAIHRGALLFAAAGNCGSGNKASAQCDGVENRVSYPAAYQGVTAVGSYDKDGLVGDYSTQASYVGLSAPGGEILSTVFGNLTKTTTGTSEASPMVAGVAAVLMAHRPDLAPAEILQALVDTARDAGDEGRDDAYGSGRIDPAAAAAQLDTGHPSIGGAASGDPLIEGSSGDRVLALQNALSAAGYDVGLPDGQFGPQTAAGVREFQQDQGSAVTGQVTAAEFNVALSLAARAPACTDSAAQAAVEAVETITEWSGVQCGVGWAVASTPWNETILLAFTFHLLRVRGDRWVEVAKGPALVATPALASGTGLSRARFNELFGGPGWPGHVSSADEAAHFIMIDAQQSQPGSAAMQLVSVWLDDIGRSSWAEWWGADGQGSLGSCIFRADSTNYFTGPHWECVWTGGLDPWMISIDEGLTIATMTLFQFDEL